jgi:hypothetical protein
MSEVTPSQRTAELPCRQPGSFLPVAAPPWSLPYQALASPAVALDSSLNS